MMKPADHQLGGDRSRFPELDWSRHPRQQNPEDPIRWPETWLLRRSLEDHELVAQGQVLDGQRSLRLQGRNQSAKNDVEHGIEAIWTIA
jgi:hypothetical protein